LKRRDPGISTIKCVLALIAFSMVLDFIYEAILYRAQLWNWIGLPNHFLIFAGAHKYPCVEYLAGIVWFVVFTFIRFTRNDRGQRLHERGLDHFTPTKRFAISQLALCGLFALGTINATIMLWIPGLYSGPPTAVLPQHVINDMCDSPGHAPTRYGPCPGAPGFRLPLRDATLSGPNP
jgi:Spirocyclase AveC-like